MALTYGSTMKSPRTVILFEKPKEQPKQKSFLESNVGLFRILIVVAEVGLSLIPGVGTAASVGIGLIAATANTALSAATGEVSGVGVAIDFGTAFIPLATDAFSALKITKAGRTAEAGALASQTSKFSDDAIKRAGKIRTRDLARAERTFGAESQKAARIFNNAPNKAKRGQALIDKSKQLASKGLDSSVASDAASFAKRITTNPDNIDNAIVEISSIEKTGIDLIEQAKLDRLSLPENLSLASQRYSRKVEMIAKEYDTTIAQISARVDELNNIFEQVKNFKFSQKVSKSKFLSEIEKMSSSKSAAFFKEVYFPKRSKFGLARAAAKKDIEKIMLELSDDGKEIFAALISNINVSGYSGKQIAEITEQTMKGLSNTDQKIILKAFSNENIGQVFGVFGKHKGIVIGGEFSGAGLAKYMGSKSFNDNWVQKIQLIDPNDLGRAFIEYGYKRLKKIINTRLEKLYHSRAAKGLKKVLKNADDIDEAMLKAGGWHTFTGRYLHGLRIITMPTALATDGVVMLTFNKLFTSSSKGKNKNGKKPVLIRASREDIRMLMANGSSYYWDVGKKKGWYKTRGGRRYTTKLATLDTKLTLFLGFVPIPALRNLLSITSNIVENIADMSRGDWHKQWFDKFSRSFKRAAINRTGRLLTRVVVGGATTRTLKIRAIKNTRTEMASIKNAFATTNNFRRATSVAINNSVKKANKIGNFVGRELQRASTITLSSVMDKDGNFKITKGGGRSKSTGQKIISKALKSGLPTSVKGSLIRHGNSRGRVVGRKLIGAKRNLGQLGRIPGALTPSGTPSIRKLTKF